MNKRLTLLALGLALAATSASAQSYSESNGPNEVITVTAPPKHEQQRSSIGAPIVNVALSREVRYDDLDLRTARGAHALRDRVRSTARDLCRELDQRYPAAEDDIGSCQRHAVYDAMAQADAAIGDERY